MWVCSLVGLTESPGTDVSVDLRRCQALVSEEFLDAAEVGSPIEHVAGKAVAERMRRGELIEPGGGDVFLQ